MVRPPVVEFKVGGRDDAVLLKVDVCHGHDAALCHGGKVLEAQVQVVDKRRLEVGVTDDDVERVALVGHGLQLCDAGLVGTHAVVGVECACLAELVAESCVGCHAPHPSAGDVACAVNQVAAAGHGRAHGESQVEVIFLAHLPESELKRLVEELVAERIAQSLVEVATQLGPELQVQDL